MKHVLALWLMAAAPLAAQEINPANSGKVDAARVDAAIKKGLEFLKARNAEHMVLKDYVNRRMGNCELVLLTYITADVPVTDPAAAALFEDMMGRKMEVTYCVSLQAMILEEIERVKYQHRIAMCGQFLIDNQSKEGYWDYGDPSVAVEGVPPPPPMVETSGGAPSATKDLKQFGEPGRPAKIKPKVRQKIVIKKTRDGTTHDNSNTQYAALGLRACHDSGVVIPKEVTAQAIKWILRCQKSEPGEGEELLELDGMKPAAAPGGRVGSTVVGTRLSVAPRGWCYRDHVEHKAYGSMTAGMAGSLCIWLYISENDEGRARTWKIDKNVLEGIQWLNKNWSVTGNPGPHEHGGFALNSPLHHYYYLYALERVGMLYGTERMGAHEWYPEGANFLLDAQKGDGSWNADTRDTCFAILFLKRATRALADVATGGSRGR